MNLDVVIVVILWYNGEGGVRQFGAEYIAGGKPVW
jgi:hypothetical protein